ncbi:MAG: hypothetical protein Q9M34_05710 [Sulfurimonas sp.]|nr:hypothetical protein [Sulfurimonas sp.]
MKTKILATILIISIFFFSNANATLLTSTTTTTTQILNLISKLSDDIGIMADRILIMADKIGVMADRIVHTEEMMSDLTLTLASQSSNTAQTVIISSGFQSVLYANDIPNFTINIAAPQMLIYVSSSMTMDTNTVSVLIANPDELAEKWPSLKTLAQNNKIYIAIKTIDGNTISSLSNVLTYTTLY